MNTTSQIAPWLIELPKWIAIGVSIAVALYSQRESANAKIKAKNADARAEEALRLASNAKQLWAEHGERDKWRMQREAEEATKRTAARKSLLLMFVHEAVELQKRWVQYAMQDTAGELSSSQPFEWTTSEMVDGFLRLGGDHAAVQALFRVKQLNFQVRNQMVAAQARAPVPVRTRAPAFIKAEWATVCSAIAELLAIAGQEGIHIQSLKEQFDSNIIDYKRLS